jgi:hypothetical protein
MFLSFLFFGANVLCVFLVEQWNRLLLLFYFSSSSSSSSVFRALFARRGLFQNLFRAVPRRNRKLWHGISVFRRGFVAGH